MDKISKMGFKDSSPYKNRKKLKIKSDSITMKGVSQPLIGVSDKGESKIMLPNQDYNFNNADYVMEYKLKKQQGGEVEKESLTPEKRKKIVELKRKLGNPTISRDAPLGRSYYNGYTNNISLADDKELVDELAHAYQKKYLGVDFSDMVFASHSPSAYTTPNTMEYGAHKEIKPYLDNAVNQALRNNSTVRLPNIGKIENSHRYFSSDNTYDVGNDVLAALDPQTENVFYVKRKPNGQYVEVSKSEGKTQIDSAIVAQMKKKLKGELDINSDVDMRGKKIKKQKGGYLPLLQNYLPTIPEDQQDKLLDALDALPEQEKYDYIETMMNGGCYKCGGKMQSGGQTPTYPELGRGNVEVEDQETAKLPDGKLVKFEGDTHEQGGIQTELPGGTVIFSDHIKAPKEITELVLGKKTNKKYSYADLSKKFPTQKSINILKNPDSDEYQINTAEITLNKNQAMLDTIFSAQEMEKQMKGNNKKFQSGGFINPRAYRPNSPYNPEFKKSPEIDWSFLTGVNTSPNISGQGEDYYNDYPAVHTEPSPTVTTGVVLPRPLTLADASVPQFEVPTDLQLVMPERNKKTAVLPNTKRGIKPKPKSVSPIQVPEDDFKGTIPLPFDPLPQRNPSLQSIGSGNSSNSGSSERDNTDLNPFESQDTEDYPGFVKSRGKSKFGINPKLAGTIMDIGLAMLDNLNVESPILFNNKTYPIFNRFVKFDSKEPGRNLALSVQQIQNSNMPEQVKQAQIAQLTAQANEQQSQVDFGNQQRYEQKQERDTNKLQQYMDRNTMVGNQDLENYLQRKGRVESLKNEFKARRKSNIVNSIRGYADYADQLNLQNQIYADNYKVNPITGRVDFTGATQDPLKQQELLMAQYQSNAQNQISLPNGATMTVLGNGNAVVVDADGKVQIVKTNQ
mgnify:CR=1 FL=1